MTPNQCVNLFIILLIHYFVTNVFEKIFVQQYITENKRPDLKEDRSVSSLGMPSGHVETTTILCLILVFYNVISIQVAIFIIIIMAFQRVLSRRHTPEQTLMGFFMGILYTIIHICTDISLYSIAILFIINLILIGFIESKIVSKMKHVPEWVNEELLATIEKKQSDKIANFIEIAFTPIFHDKIFYYTYKDLEADLDVFIEKIKSQKIDCIVGIKTGGAILASYIAKKMKKPCYFIKPQNKKFMCNKNDFSLSSKTIIYYTRYYTSQKDKNDIEMCEIITDNIENKNILLIDESVGSGSTMNAGIEYLYKEKGVSKVNSYIFEKNSKFNNVIHDNINVWSWGFDN